MAYLNQVFGDDRDRAVVFGTGEPIEHGQHAAGGGVLHRQHQPLDEAVFERSKRGHEAREADVLTAWEQLVGRPEAVGVGFALVSDPHDGRE
jgi:hypothetical protein